MPVELFALRQELDEIPDWAVLVQTGPPYRLVRRNCQTGESELVTTIQVEVEVPMDFLRPHLESPVLRNDRRRD